MVVHLLTKNLQTQLAWDYEYRLDDGPGSPRLQLEKAARGAARASRATGVPITCHTRASDELGLPLLDIFEEVQENFPYLDEEKQIEIANNRFQELCQ